MRLKFKNKKITGILTVLPENEVLFEDEIKNYDFPEKKSLKLKKIMGFKKHRIVKNKETTSSDLCVYGVNYLIKQDKIKKNEIDAIIFISQTPDYLVPPTSNIIQGELGLKKDIICMDINQACAGYTMGLLQSFMLLEQENIKKVLLLNADVMSVKTSKYDRNSFPLIGDGAAITLVEKSNEGEIYANHETYGEGYGAIIVPAGGARIPCTERTKVLEQTDEGNRRTLEDVKMDGTGVFNFVMNKVPDLIEDILDYSKLNKGEIDYFLFHQPNKFMLKKLAEKIEVSENKMPNNIVENFGNANSVTIPTNIVYNLKSDIKEKSYKVCLSGFGAGLSCGSIVMNLGNLKFCENIDYKEE